MRVKDEIHRSIPFAIRLLWGAIILGPVSWIIIKTSVLAGLSSSEAASWVQAVGSIGAIVGAAALAIWQMRRVQNNSEADKAEKRRAMYAVIHNAAEWAGTAGDFVEKRPVDWAFKVSWRIALGPSFSASIQTISKVPAHELGSSLLVAHFVTIIGGMETIDRVVENYLSKEVSEERTEAFYMEIQGQANIIKRSWEKFAKISGYEDFSVMESYTSSGAEGSSSQ